MDVAAALAWQIVTDHRRRTDREGRGAGQSRNGPAMDGLIDRHETLRLEVDRLTEQLDEQRRLLAEVRQQIIEVERGT